MTAVVLESEIPLKKEDPSFQYEEQDQPFFFVLANAPGHTPRLVIPYDRISLFTPRHSELRCAVRDKSGDIKDTSLCNGMTSSNREAVIELRGLEVHLPQGGQVTTEYKRGQRELGLAGSNRYWKESLQKMNAPQDLTWVSDIGKASGNGKIREQLLDADWLDLKRANQESVAIARLTARGRLTADPIPSWRESIDWGWDLSGCGIVGLPDYGQVMANALLEADIEQALITVYVPGSPRPEWMIVLQGSGSITLTLSNNTDSFDCTAARVENEHFEHYYELVDTPGTCKAKPFVENCKGKKDKKINPSSVTPGAAAASDTFCPPTVLWGKKRP
ncbi:MAG: hypothetical protein GY716_22155 [bacterium]|nr:hypothetical protein [bacterium]